MPGLRPVRRSLPHEVPSWVPDGAVYFLTLCARERGGSSLVGRVEGILRAAEACHADGRWFLHLMVVMPDHLHLLAVFPQEPGLRRVVAAWKRFLAAQEGVVWQRDFFEHRLRAEESFDEKAHYIRMNPVRAGLCSRWEDWPHRWPR